MADENWLFLFFTHIAYDSFEQSSLSDWNLKF